MSPKKYMSILMLSFLLILSGCSTKTTEPTQIRVEKVFIPASLLEIDCLIREAGDTPRLLAAAYLSEKSCRKAYQKLIEGIKRSYTKEGYLADDNSSPTK